MLDEMFSRQIRRTNRNFLIVAALALTAVLVPAKLYWPYVSSVLRPAPIGSAELNSATYPNPFIGTFVRIPVAELAVTRLEEHALNSDRVLANFLAVKVGNRFLLSKVSVHGLHKNLTGKLIEMPDNVRKLLFADPSASGSNLTSQFYVYELDTTQSRFENWPQILWGLFFLGLGVACLVQGVYRTAVPDCHPIMKSLKRYGEPGEVSAKLAQELRVEGDREKYGYVRVTSNWLVQAMSLKTDIVRLSDIVWAYPKVIKQYYGPITVAKISTIVVHDRYGKRVEFGISKDRSPVFLQSLERRTPWAIYGFSEELKKMWTKNRAEFYRGVDRRRESLNSQAAKSSVREDSGVLVNS